MFDFLRKRDYQARLAPGGETLTVRGGEKLLSAALAAGLNWPHDCRVGSCGTCRCVLRGGRIKALTDFSYTLEPAEIARGVILACQAQLRSDIEVEIELGATAAAIDVVAGRITALTSLTHDIVEVEVGLERSALAGAVAGQYIEVGVAGIAAPRSYSFARAPSAGGTRQVHLVIRHVPGGEFTDWLFAGDRVGAALTLRGPYGRFRLHDARGRMICVAGGSGLAPIMALLEDAIAARRVQDCVVLFGARTQRDLYHLDRLEALARQWPAAFTLTPVLSEAHDDRDWHGARGLVTSALASLAAPGLDDDQAYLCGPPPMVDAAIGELTRLGMPDAAIYFDKFLDASTQPGGRDALAGQA